MSTSSINNLASLQSILSSAIQNAGLATNDTSNSLSSIDLSVQQPDQSHLSQFAQLLSALQRLQQTDPTKYQQVTQQIAANLQTAAKTAESDGNTTLANQLNQLSTDFTNASKSGQLPNVHDLAQAISAHHHHHHHHAHAASVNSNQATNPLNIILSTLSNAGINTSND